MSNDLKDASRREILKKLGLGTAALVVAAPVLGESTAEAKQPGAGFDGTLRALERSGESVGVTIKLPRQSDVRGESILTPVIANVSRLRAGVKIAELPVQGVDVKGVPLPPASPDTFWVGGSLNGGFLNVALSVNNGQMEVAGPDQFYTQIAVSVASAVAVGDNSRCSGNGVSKAALAPFGYENTVCGPAKLG